MLYDVCKASPSNTVRASVHKQKQALGRLSSWESAEHASMKPSVQAQHSHKTLGTVVQDGIPALGSQGWVDSWNSLVGQPRLQGEFQQSEKPCFRINK